MDNSRWGHISPPFQSIKDTVKSTGLSEFYLRRLLKAGELPHIRSGAKVLVNVPRLLENLMKGGDHSHGEMDF